jgi:holo-[acyl-carrier protein] synthase
LGQGIAAVASTRESRILFPRQARPIIGISIAETRPMTDDPSERQPMASAPRDGTLVLVAIRASEQGPEEFDHVRFATSARSGEGAWVATDSDPLARIAYADAELAGWMPLPGQLPRLRSERTRETEPDATPEEGDGSAI